MSEPVSTTILAGIVTQAAEALSTTAAEVAKVTASADRQRDVLSHMAGRVDTLARAVSDASETCKRLATHLDRIEAEQAAAAAAVRTADNEASVAVIRERTARAELLRAAFETTSKAIKSGPAIAIASVLATTLAAWLAGALHIPPAVVSAAMPTAQEPASANDP